MLTKVANTELSEPDDLVPEELRKPIFSTDTIRVYLHEIGRIKLLTAEQEILYARKIQPMIAAYDVKNALTKRLGRPPTEQEWADELGIPTLQLQKRIDAGLYARRKMVEANLRLVVSVAKKYLNRGVDFLDLIQEGSIGLQRAAEKFDHSKGYKFSTYSYWWIRQGITRAIAEQGRTVRLPVHLIEFINKLKKVQRQLQLKLNRPASEEEIAAELEETVEKVRLALKMKANTRSLDAPISKTSDDPSPLLDHIHEDLSTTPDEYAEGVEIREGIQEILSLHLTNREADVLKMRCGYHGKPMSLEEIGGVFNVSRERIRQIESKAKRKIRSRHGAMRRLQEYSYAP